MLAINVMINVNFIETLVRTSREATVVTGLKSVKGHKKMWHQMSKACSQLRDQAQE